MCEWLCDPNCYGQAVPLSRTVASRVQPFQHHLRPSRSGLLHDSDAARVDCARAIDYKFWGWTPHNYVQPQFANWADAKWHRTLNDRFLNS